MNYKENIYQYSATNLQGKDVDLSDYKGKIILVVNTASKCGLTVQFEGLEKLYQSYKDSGFEILGFPCNQFANQEPGDTADIEKVCYVNYGVSFQMFSKVKVNGENAHPLFKYLKKNLKGAFGEKIKWNFTKFLIDKNGIPVKRFAPTTKPEKIKKNIEILLN